MVKKAINEYNPDYVSVPGETLYDVLVSINMSQADLSRRMGRPVKTINEIIKGKSAITPVTALQFEKVLGISANFWNNREKQYRAFLAQKTEASRISEKLAWLQNFPIKDIIKKGWIKKYDDSIKQINELLSYFSIAESKQWNELWRKSVTYRKSNAFKSNPYSISAWLRKGELEASKIECSRYNERTFKRNLRTIRDFTRKDFISSIPRIKKLCSGAGIAFVLVPEIKGTYVIGASRWLNPETAIIQLSLRYKTDDHIWFTFFHEAGHLLLHGKRRAFVDNMKDNNIYEDEANKYSREFLISVKQYEEFLNSYGLGEKSIASFAKKINIAPGILVGRLQHDKRIKYYQRNSLKKRYVWDQNSSKIN